MKRINRQEVIIPQEFKVACAIYKIEIAEVLQIFVDHVTLYDTMSGVYNEGFSEASYTVSSFVQEKKRHLVRSKAMRNCRTFVMSCIANIKAISQKKTRLPNAQRKKAQTHVNRIFETMQRIYTISDMLFLDEYSFIRLSKDFCVFCEAYNCYPKQFLEYFMKKISVADAHAHKGLKIIYDNHTFSLFSNIADGFGRDNSGICHLTDLEVNFYERMHDLYLELYIIRDLDERKSILRNFYLSHYYTIIQN